MSYLLALGQLLFSRSSFISILSLCHFDNFSIPLLLLSLLLWSCGFSFIKILRLTVLGSQCHFHLISWKNLLLVPKKFCSSFKRFIIRNLFICILVHFVSRLCPTFYFIISFLHLFLKLLFSFIL